MKYKRFMGQDIASLRNCVKHRKKMVLRMCHEIPTLERFPISKQGVTEGWIQISSLQNARLRQTEFCWDLSRRHENVCTHKNSHMNT